MIIKLCFNPTDFVQRLKAQRISRVSEHGIRSDEQNTLPVQWLQHPVTGLPLLLAPANALVRDGHR
jgi:hypothetical protein